MPDVGSYLEQYNLLASMNAVDVASLVAEVANRLGLTTEQAAHRQQWRHSTTSHTTPE